MCSDQMCSVCPKAIRCKAGLAEVAATKGLLPEMRAAEHGQVDVARQHSVHNRSSIPEVDIPSSTVIDWTVHAVDVSAVFEPLRRAIDAANYARIQLGLGLVVAGNRDLAVMQRYLAEAIRHMVDSEGNCLVSELKALTVDLALIAMSTLASPLDPDGCGLTAGNAGFLVSPRCPTPGKLGLALGFELENLGFIIVNGNGALAEFVPAKKLKGVLVGVGQRLATE